MVKRRGLPYRVLDDHTGKVGRAYGALTTPDMFVIDAKGGVAYRGAIDDDAHGDKSKPRNFVGAALAQLLAGKPVGFPPERPYGCTVKYKKGG